MSTNNIVSLAFKADSSQAKREIQSLVSELDKLSTKTLKTSLTKDIGDDMKNAAREVNKFSSLLKDATNVNTGKLDLSKLNQSLKSANTDLTKVSQSFKTLGNDGTRAFANVVKQINAAEVPLKKTNSLVDKMWDNLKKTAGWQVSSSAIHALVSGVSSAFRYAEDLNQSLNNIRIVTGYNAEQMAIFADEANKAAKALSTTTTAYSDASLIYFQQGLSKEEVKERSDITIKMANVTRQSATEVSNQLTSIWNNFDDGTKSLEYYADVLTKLGAATASSTDEIAGGLEKFAAVADTIGLSYEYAASALATITSNTRQSEEVVGTALKTIFARIQGLNLGETLNDGTTLNKYSEALDKVGISIFDSAGELKKMDSILDEMGSKWQTLNDAQQVALAQTVAGVRQYNQLVSLMDNWNNGDADSMATNLATARGATGELQSQADIYAESWEAAQKKVKASLETLYGSLIDDTFFIKLLNTASSFIDIVNDLIDGLGGVEGLLATISTYVLRIARTKFSDELKRLTGPSQKKQAIQAQETKIEANQKLKEVASAGKSHESQAIAKSYSEISNIQKQMWQQSDKLSESQVKILQGQLDQLEVLSDIVANKAKALDLAEKESRVAERQLQLQQKIKVEQSGLNELQGKGGLLNRQGKQFTDDEINQVNATRHKMGLGDMTDEQKKVLQVNSASLSDAAKESHLEKYKKVIADINAELDEARRKMLGLPDILKEYESKSKAIGTVKQSLQVAPDADGAQAAAALETAMSGLNEETKEAIYNAAGSKKEFESLVAGLKNVEKGAVQDSTAFIDLSAALDQARMDIAAITAATANSDTGIDADIIINRTAAIDDQVDASLDLKEAESGLREEIDNTNKTLNQDVSSIPAWQDSIVNAATAVSAFSMALSAMGGIWDTIKDPDMSGWEKFTTVLTTLVTVIPGVVMGIKALQEAKIKDTIVNALNIASEKILAKAKDNTAAASKRAAKAQDQENRKQQEGIATDIAEQVTDNSKKGKGAKAGGKSSAAGSSASGAGSGGSTTSALTNGGASLAGSIGIAIAGIAILVGTVMWAVHQAQAAERAVETAKASAEQLRQNYDAVKAAQEELNNQTSAYSSAREQVDKLTKGTQEYQNAVHAANEAAIELLETNKNLVYTIQDGQIVIDKDSLEAQQELQQQNLEYAQAAKLAGQNEVSKAEENLKKRNMARDLKSDADKTEKGRNATAGAILGGIGAGAAAGAIGGAVSGAGVFSWLTGIIGLAVGATAGAVVGIAQATSTKDENESLEKLEKAYLEDATIMQRIKDGSMTETEWESIGIEDEALRESLQKNADSVTDLIQEMAANTAAINAQNDLVAANALADNKAVQNSEYQDKIIDIAGDTYGVAYDKALEESDWIDTWGKDDISKATRTNDEAKQVFADYLKYAGLEGRGYTLTDTTGTDKKREFIYEDTQGNDYKVSLQTMQAARASYEASNTLNETATKLAQTFDILAKSSSEANQALLSFVSTKNFEEATQGELSGMSQTVGDLTQNADGTYQTKGIRKYLEKNLNETLTDDVAVRYGYESADAMMQAFAKQMVSAQEAWKNIKIPAEFEFSKNMTLEAAKALESQIKEINLGPLGEQAGQMYISQLNEIMKELDPEDYEKALSQLTEIDWSDWDAADKAKSIMKDFGVEIDEGSEKWKNFVSNMQIAARAVPDFTTLKQNLQNVSGILGDLDFGSIIDDEDYQKLIDYNDEWERFFILQADGSRKFIGDSSKMLEATRDSITEQKKQLEERKEITDAVKQNENIDWKISEESVNKKGEKLLDTQINTRMANATESLVENKEIKNLLSQGGYSEEIIADIIKEARNGNREKLDAMLEYIDSSMTADYVALEMDLDEMMASTATSIEELNQLWMDGVVDSEEAFLKQQQALVTAQIESATKLSELQAALDSVGGKYEDQELVDKKLIELGEQYKNCSDEVNVFTEALSNGKDMTDEARAALIEEARALLEVSLEMNELAEKHDLDAEATANLADRLAKNNANLKDGEQLTEKQKKAYADMAIASQRLDRGLKNINENLDDYKKVIKKADRNSAEFSETMDDLKNSLADVFNVADGNMFSDTFAEGLLDSEDFKKALDGDIEALNRLRADATVDIGDNIISKLGDAANEEQYKFDSLGNKIADSAYTASSAWEYVRSVLADGFTVDEINDVNFVNSLNDMIRASGMTKEEIQSMLGSMGVSAKVKTTYEPQETEIPTYYEYSVNEGWSDFSYTDGATGEKVSEKRPKIRKMTVPGAPVKVMGHVPVYSLETTSGDTTSGGKIEVFSEAAPKAVSSGSTTSGTSGSGGGGGNSTPKKADTVKKTDVVDRYKEVDDSLDDLARKTDKASKAADRLWGPARVAQLKKVNNAIQDEIKGLKQKYNEASANLELDKKALKDTIKSEAGVTLKDSDFDANGNFIKYDEILSDMYKDLDKAITKANADGNATEEEQEEINAIQERIDAVKEAIEQYDETRELMEDINDEIEDKIYEWQDNNYEMLNYKLEIKVEIEDSKLEILEYYLGKAEDDIFSIVEAYASMGDVVGAVTSKLEANEIAMNDLETAYMNGEISMVDYKEGMRNIQSSIAENLEALAEYKEQMLDFYGNVMSMAIDEISIYTDAMENLNSVLDHYSNILEITGQQEDTETKKKLLNAHAQNLQNEIDVQKEVYARTSKDADHWFNLMNSVEIGSDQYELYKRNWQAAQEAADDAQDKILSKTEEWLEDMKSLAETEMKEFADIMERSLTGGITFDQLLTQIERRNTLQEEYLTDTNKIYETNKLMRTAQQEIDKTTNSIAKNKLKNFVKETNELQNQTKLSKFELEIQQAKYDLLLAEIALEDAQNAKTKVRLQKDSEGNFAYVYTADQGAIADAQQKVEDMQNALYNISLEGANQYAQKYAEAMAQCQDEITELTQRWMNGELASDEEYYRLRAEIEDYYYNLLKDYSNLYGIAVATDSNAAKDAWVDDTGIMKTSTEEWCTETQRYFTSVEETIKTWKTNTEEALKDFPLEKAIEDATTKSDTLKTSLIGEDGKGGVVAATMSEVDAAKSLAETFAKELFPALEKVVGEYEKLMNLANQKYTTPDTPVVSPAIQTPEEETAPTTTTPPKIETPKTETPKKETPKTSGPQGDGKLDVGDTATYTGGLYYGDSYGGGGSGSRGPGKKVTISSIKSDRPYPIHVTSSNSAYGWLKASQLQGYDTGGYTGAWGSYGKLAMLHEKELVLNAEDTENFLMSMDILNKIVSTIDLYSLNSQLGNMLSTPHLSNLNNGETLEQQVHIEASFPNVTNHNEIEEAFNNLINISSQYANRK